jgi:UDP-N-acetylglucosamine 2-epimerase
MKSKLKVVTIVGTRPEIIRLSRVISSLENNFEHILVHTGQNYDYTLNQVFFDQLDIKQPDYYLEASKETPIDTIANTLSKVDKLLKDIEPDAVLILGDTNSALSVLSAKRRKIPTFHMEAGNRCFDQRVPEELNRKVVDHLSDINMPYSSIAREYLLREGLSPDRIVKTGSPMKEVLEFYMPKIEQSDVLSRLSLISNKYYLLSSHREENVDSEYNLSKIIDILNYLSGDNIVIMPIHPRTRKRLAEINYNPNKNIKLIEPLGFFDYVKLQMNAIVVLSDSGTITEESSILNFRALNIREAHERPEGMEEGAVIMSGLGLDNIKSSLAILKDQLHGSHGRTLNLVSDYNCQNVSEKVVRIIQSYTEYINKTVWKK